MDDALDRAVAGALARDPADSERLVRALYPTVASAVRRHCGGSDRFDDLVQDVFVRIFERLPQYRGRGCAILAWARRVAATVCLNDHRHLAARPERPLSDLSAAQVNLLTEAADHPIGNTPEQAALACVLVERLLGSLTPPERMIVELVYLEGCGAQEVAELSGWSSVRVRVTAFRARRKMRAALERQGFR